MGSLERNLRSRRDWFVLADEYERGSRPTERKGSRASVKEPDWVGTNSPFAGRGEAQG